MLSKKQLGQLRRTPLNGRNKLLVARKLAGLTQVQLAAILGDTTQPQISDDEAGKYVVMSLDKARAYARVLGCTVDDIFPARQSDEALTA